MQGITAVVLAGTRPGGDPLAEYAGVSHKALIEVGGCTMVERVVAALVASSKVGQIVVAIDRPDLLVGLPGLQSSIATRSLSVMSTRSSPSATVAAALEAEPAPLLITTADHALLTANWVDEFLEKCPNDADVVAAWAGRADVEAAVPNTARTWLRFNDGDFSGCNLILLANPKASKIVALWRDLEKERKYPLRMMRRLGWSFALRYRLGCLKSSSATARVGELTGGAKLAFAQINDGCAAIDVDKPADLDLVRQLVAEGRASSRSTSFHVADKSRT